MGSDKIQKNNGGRLKILAVGDPHFKANNKRSTDILHQDVLDKISKTRPDLVVILGDTLHDFEQVLTPVHSRAVRFIRDICDRVRVILLIGNHDLCNNQVCFSEDHGFLALKQWPRCTVVDHPIVETIKGFKLLFTPFIPTGMYNEKLAEYLTPDLHCIFSHQEYRGANMHSSSDNKVIMLSEEGDRWPMDSTFTVSGHIHKYHRPQENIVYAGTAYPTGFGEEGMKSVSLLRLYPSEMGSKIKDIESDKTFVFRAKNVVIVHRRLKAECLAKKTVFIVCNDKSTYENLDLSGTAEYKIKISGTPAEIKTFLKQKCVKEWKKNGALITKNVIMRDRDELQNHSAPTDSFEKILYDKILGQPILEKKYEHYFGKIIG